MEHTSEPHDVRHRLHGAFSTAYLTLISIIQGVALGYLTTKVDGVLQQPLHLQVWLLISGTLAIYITLWNEYLMGALAFIWIPTLLDAVIPFALFAAEIAMASALARDNLRWWLIALGGVGVVGLIAYINMFLRARDQSANVLDALGWHKWPPVILSAISAVVFIGGGIWASNSQLQVWRIAVTGVALAMIIIFLLRSIPYWQRIITYAGGRLKANGKGNGADPAKGEARTLVTVPNARPADADSNATP